MEARSWKTYWRGMASMVVAFSFGLMAVTGIVLYLSPQGRIANATGWAVLGLTKQDWIALHTTLGMLFLISSCFHLFLNWRTLFGYLSLRHSPFSAWRILLAAGVVVLVCIGTLCGIPPLSYVAELNEHGQGQSYAALQKRASAPIASDIRIRQDDSAAHGERRGEGRGWGRQTLQELCDTEGILLQTALAILESQGFSANANTTLKELGWQKDMSPSSIRTLLTTQSK